MGNYNIIHMKNKALVPIILLIVGLAVGFGGGYFFRGQQATSARAAGFAGAAGANGVPGGFQRFTGSRGGGTGVGARGGAVTGTILSIDPNSMTVKMSDGSSKIVLLSGTTTYSNTSTASQTDLKAGSPVMVFGSTNSDGSVTATNVQINPMTFNRPQGSPAPSPAAQ